MTAGSTMQTACGQMTSRIPDEFLSGTISPGERRLIHTIDILAQVNDRQWLLIQEVGKQAAITNGRVTSLEKKAVEAEKTLSGVRAARRAAMWLCTAAGGVTMLVLDKLLGRWLGVLLAVLCVAGCAHHPVAPAAYTKPSVVPVAVPVATAREAIGQVRAGLAQGRASAVSGTSAGAKAAELSKDLAEKTAAAKTEEAKALGAEAAALQVQVAQFRNDLARITQDLEEADAKAEVAEKAAQEAQEQIAKLDTQIGAQTSTLNQTAQDLNTEQAARKTAEAAQHKAEAALASLRVKVGIWIVVLLLIVGASVYFKLVRFGL